MGVLLKSEILSSCSICNESQFLGLPNHGQSRQDRSSGQGDANHARHGLRVSTILLILQDLAAEELEESFDCIDEVVKIDGCSCVKVDERVA